MSEEAPNEEKADENVTEGEKEAEEAAEEIAEDGEAAEGEGAAEDDQAKDDEEAIIEETADETPAEETPARSVKLVSSLDGLTEIEEGTEIVMTVEISGFSEDEIETVTWQYRPAEEEDFLDVEGAGGLTYTYFVSAENIHYEWRVVLMLKP